MTQAPTASLTPAGGKDFASSVIYQVYPKSFYSSAGGAYGDLRGVIEKVPYIASLGVDMVWFNPFFASPQTTTATTSPTTTPLTPTWAPWRMSKR